MAVIDDHDDDANAKSTPAATLPDELKHLITAFVPTNPVDERSKAFLTLSAFCQGARASTDGQNSNLATQKLVQAFSPSVTSKLSETNQPDLLAGVSFLTSLFQVDWESAAAILQQDGVLESIMDIVDLNPSGELPIQVAQLFSQASGYKSTRALLLSEPQEWLGTASKNTSDAGLRAAATTALIKLLKGAETDRSETLGDVSQQDPPSTELTLKKESVHAAVVKQIIASGESATSVADAVEGLAYLSVNPEIKDNISRDKPFLKKLFAFVPHRKAGSLRNSSAATISTVVYGVLAIVANLCAYRPRLNEEQTQIQKLRQMANAKKGSPALSPLDDDDSVKERIKRLIEAGVLEVFPQAMRVDSPRICLAAGNALLGIIEDQANRGKVLQAGGAKVLGQVLKHAIPSRPSKEAKSSTPLEIDPTYLGSVQALAKLAITSSPVQIFGPNEGAMYDAIRPFSLMIQGSSSNLLQKFEAMMALTNLSSQSTELATRVANSDGLLSRVELLLLEDHTMVRRAAMELICNLIAGSDDVFERYGGTAAKSKLQVVLALSDVEDLPTRIAASGAVATLTSAPPACQNLISLQWERHRAFRVLGRLIDPSAVPRNEDEDGDEIGEIETNPGLAHRAFVTVKNVFSGVSDTVVRKKLAKEAEESGLPQAIRNYVKASLTDSNQAQIVRLGIEALKAMD